MKVDVKKMAAVVAAGPSVGVFCLDGEEAVTVLWAHPRHRPEIEAFMKTLEAGDAPTLART